MLLFFPWNALPLSLTCAATPTCLTSLRSFLNHRRRRWRSADHHSVVPVGTNGILVEYFLFRYYPRSKTETLLFNWVRVVMSESPKPESASAMLDGGVDPSLLTDQMKVTPLPCEIKEGEYNLQQLSTVLNQKENSLQMLVSHMSEMDQKKDDLLKELKKLHQTIDTSNSSDIIEELTTKLKILKALEKEESQLLSVYKEKHADLPSEVELEKKKKELASKLRAIVSLKRQYDDVPGQTELIQYERRFSELYAQIQGKHRQTRKHYATYNALLDIKELMLKETSLLNSIDSQFQDAMSSTIGCSKLVDSMEVIVKGTKQKLDKAQLTLLAEQRICESLEEKHATVVAEQRHFSYLLKAFQEECARNEKLRKLAST